MIRAKLKLRTAMTVRRVRLTLTSAAAATVTALAAVFWLVLAAAPATATPLNELSTSDVNGLQYSSDGTNFGAELPELFSTAPALIPGGTVERSFWIRNDSSMAVDIFIVPHTAEAGVEIVVGGGTGELMALGSGKATDVAIQAHLPVDAGNSTQDRYTHVKLEVTVTESIENAVSNPDQLGYTGGSAGIWPVGAAVLISGVGIYAATRRHGLATEDGKAREEQP